MLLRAESSEWWGSGCLAPRLVALLHHPRDDAARRVVLVQRVRELLPHLRGRAGRNALWAVCLGHYVMHFS